MSESSGPSVSASDRPIEGVLQAHHAPASFERTHPIGLIAGAGRFPVAFATKARELGMPVACIGLRGLASADLEAITPRFSWLHVGRLGQMIRYFRREKVRSWVMAGKVHKSAMNYRWRVWHARPDWRMVRLWYLRTRDKRDDSLLAQIVAEFEAEGLTCRSALELCPELLVQTGVLTRRPPTAGEWRDIDFGWELAKEMGRRDIGQSVMVREQAVLAVEAIEGTDLAIQRAGGLCPRGGFTVVKVAKPQQDMRFDVPTIGTATIETMKQAGARVLAVEADKTIILDAAAAIALADRYGMTIVAR